MIEIEEVKPHVVQFYREQPRFDVGERGGREGMRARRRLRRRERRRRRQREGPVYACCGYRGGCGGPCAAFPHWHLTT